MKKSFLVVVIGLGLILIISLGSAYRQYRRDRYQRQQELQAKTQEVKVTIIEGWSIKDITEALIKQNLTTSSEFGKALNNFDLTDYAIIANSKPKNASLEGYLFPDTYRFAKNSTPNQLIAKMLDDFAIRLKSVGVTADQDSFTIPNYDRKMTLYQILTLASIVEKESGGKDLTADQLLEQREIIAGIFYNRLAIGQALESDATINYITGKNDPSVSSQDQNVKSPYNTYRNAGLPPGPICSPSLASIKAVLLPKKTDYYYFFHKQPSGEVVYSKTFDEHMQKKAAN